MDSSASSHSESEGLPPCSDHDCTTTPNEDLLSSSVAVKAKAKAKPTTHTHILTITSITSHQNNPPISKPQPLLQPQSTTHTLRPLQPQLTNSSSSHHFKKTHQQKPPGSYRPYPSTQNAPSRQSARGSSTCTNKARPSHECGLRKLQRLRSRVRVRNQKRDYRVVLGAKEILRFVRRVGWMIRGSGSGVRSIVCFCASL